MNKKQKGDGHRGSAFVKFKEAASAKLAAEISSKFWDKKLEWSEKQKAKEYGKRLKLDK